jgi:hypothetical protein
MTFIFPNQYRSSPRVITYSRAMHTSTIIHMEGARQKQYIGLFWLMHGMENMKKKIVKNIQASSHPSSVQSYHRLR